MSSNLSYGILDCCFIPITAGFFITRHWKIDPDRLGLKLRTYDEPINGGEKHGSRNLAMPEIQTGAGELTTSTGQSSPAI